MQLFRALLIALILFVVQGVALSQTPAPAKDQPVLRPGKFYRTEVFVDKTLYLGRVGIDTFARAGQEVDLLSNRAVPTVGKVSEMIARRIQQADSVNLTPSLVGDSLIVTNSRGDGFVVPAASYTSAGLLSSRLLQKLESIEAGSRYLSNQMIVDGLDAQLGGQGWRRVTNFQPTPTTTTVPIRDGSKILFSLPAASPTTAGAMTADEHKKLASIDPGKVGNGLSAAQVGSIARDSSLKVKSQLEGSIAATELRAISIAKIKADSVGRQAVLYTDSVVAQLPAGGGGGLTEAEVTQIAETKATDKVTSLDNTLRGVLASKEEVTRARDTSFAYTRKLFDSIPPGGGISIEDAQELDNTLRTEFGTRLRDTITRVGDSLRQQIDNISIKSFDTLLVRSIASDSARDLRQEFNTKISQIKISGVDLGLQNPRYFEALQPRTITNGNTTAGWIDPGIPASINGVNSGSVDLTIYTREEAGIGPAAYYRPDAPIAVNDYPYATIRFRKAPGGLNTNPNFDHSDFLAVVASQGASLDTSGFPFRMVNISRIPTTFADYTIPMAGIDSIGSIGFYMNVDPTPENRGSGIERVNIRVDSIWFPQVNEVQKIKLAGGTPMVTPAFTPSFPTGYTGERIPEINVANDREANLVGLHGVKHLRDWGVYSSTTTDMTDLINQVIDQLEPGDVLQFDHGMPYLIHGTIKIRNKRNIKIDFNHAILYDNQIRADIGIGGESRHYIVPDASHDIVLENIRIFGFDDRRPVKAANLFANFLAGSPRIVDKSVVLDSTGDKTSMNWINHLGRHYDAPSGQLIHQVDLTMLSSASRDTVLFEVLMDNHSEEMEYLFQDSIVHQEYIIIDDVERVYPVQWEPTDLSQKPIFTLSKVSTDTGSVEFKSINVYDAVDYNNDEEFSNGIDIEDDSYRVTVNNFWVENVGGNGVRVSGPYCKVTNGTVRAAATQGYTANFTLSPIFENITALEIGRSGLDFEPYANEWEDSSPRVINYFCRNPLNNAVTLANWYRLNNVYFENFEHRGTGAAWEGGSKQGVFLNLKGDGSFTFQGHEMLISNLQTKGFIRFKSTARLFKGDTVRTGRNILVNWQQINTTGPGDHFFIVDDPTTYIGPGISVDIDGGHNGSTPGSQGSPYTFSNGINPVVGFHEQRYSAAFPNTYKGVVYTKAWFPEGIDDRGEGMYVRRGLSHTDTMANNFNDIDIEVPPGVDSMDIEFPKLYDPQISFKAVVDRSFDDRLGTMTPGDTFHYLIAPHPQVGGGHLMPQAASHTVGAGHDCIEIRLDNFADKQAGFHFGQFSIYRSSDGGATYDKVYRVKPNGLGFQIGAQLRDMGDTLTIFNIDAHGYGPKLNGSSYMAAEIEDYDPATGEHLQNTTGWEATPKYSIGIQDVNWDSGFPIIKNKSRKGFTVKFPSPSPTDGSGRLSWLLTR